MTGTFKLKEQNGMWTVYERGYPIANSKHKSTARKFLSHLKYGGAFEGKTPDFILKSGPTNLDKTHEDPRNLKRER